MDEKISSTKNMTLTRTAVILFHAIFQFKNEILPELSKSAAIPNFAGINQAIKELYHMIWLN